MFGGGDAPIRGLMPSRGQLWAAAEAAGCAVGVWAAADLLFSAILPMLAAELLFAAIAVLALAGFARLPSRPAFGAANAITLGRSALIAVLAGHAIEPPDARDAAWWIAAALAGTALLLDGVDGWLARRRRAASAFGARFDMEVDALAALVLSGVLWQAGKAGPWVLLIGALRYLFVLAGWAFDALRRPLPPSQRRRAVCALQGALLVACFVPLWPAAIPTAMAALALALTALSFLIDTVWLIRRRPGAL